MDKKNYLSIQSFWMFVAGLIVGLLVLLALMQIQNLQDGQTRVLRYTPEVEQLLRSGVDMSRYGGVEGVSIINPQHLSGDGVGIINPQH